MIIVYNNISNVINKCIKIKSLNLNVIKKMFSTNEELVEKSSNIISKKFISLIENEEIQFQSFITLTFPQKCERDFIKSFRYFVRSLRKKYETLIYFYVIELSNNNNFHIHMVVTVDFSKNFFSLKEGWIAALGLTEIKSEIIHQVLDFKKIDNSSESVSKLINYMFKSLSTNKNLELINAFLLTKNTSPIQNIFGGEKKLIKNFFSAIKFHTFIESPIVNAICSNTNNVIENHLNKLNYNFDLSTKKNKLLLFREIDNELKATVNFASNYDISFVMESLSSFTNKLVKKNASSFASIYQFAKLIAGLLKDKFILNIKEIYQNKKSNNLPTLFFQGIVLQPNVVSGGIFITLMLTFINLLLTSTTLLVIVETLGATMLKLFKNEYLFRDTESDYVVSASRSIGHVTFVILKKLFESVIGSIQVSTPLSVEFIGFEKEFYKTNEFVLNLDIKKSNKLKKIWVNILKHRLLTLTSKEVMIVPPLSWCGVNAVKIVQNEDKKIYYFDASKICNGGFLLNNLFLKESFLKKTSIGTTVSLKVSTQLINTINKLQNFKFVVDNKLFSFYKSVKRFDNDYISNSARVCLSKNIKELRLRKKKLFDEISNLKKNALESGVSVNLKELSDKISNVDVELNQIIARLSKSEQQVRITNLFQNFIDDIYYYVYTLDFRGRIYPSNLDMHPMGNQYAKAFTSFETGYLFNLDDFKKFAVSSYQKIVLKSELDVLTTFDLFIKQKMLQFRLKLAEIFKLAEHPLMFIKCCLEYEQYQNAQLRGEKYYSKMPIYLDATSSGPQVLSLFYGLDTYSKFLNLTAQNLNTVKGDFYIGIIKDFIVLLKKEKKHYIDIEKFESNEQYQNDVLLILRKGLKKIIMTQFYGVTNYSCTGEYEEFLKKEKCELDRLGLLHKLQETNNNFIKDFLVFIKKIDLFQLKNLLEFLVEKLGQKPLSWSLFNNIEIEIQYKKIKKSLYTPKFGGKRSQYTFYSVEKKVSSKQKTAAMANFVHSIDAYIMSEVIKKTDFPIIPIHDCWGVPINKVSELRVVIRQVYAELVENNTLFNVIISRFEKYLEENVSEAVSNEFKKFVLENQQLGSLKKQDILNSEYIVFYD